MEFSQPWDDAPVKELRGKERERTLEQSQAELLTPCISHGHLCAHPNGCTEWRTNYFQDVGVDDSWAGSVEFKSNSDSLSRVGYGIASTSRESATPCSIDSHTWRPQWAPRISCLHVCPSQPPREQAAECWQDMDTPMLLDGLNPVWMAAFSIAEKTHTQGTRSDGPHGGLLATGPAFSVCQRSGTPSLQTPSGTNPRDWPVLGHSLLPTSHRDAVSLTWDALNTQLTLIVISSWKPLPHSLMSPLSFLQSASPSCHFTVRGKCPPHSRRPVSPGEWAPWGQGLSLCLSAQPSNSKSDRPAVGMDGLWKLLL